MELLIAAVLANWIGQAAGWWGPWFSSKSGGRLSGSGGSTGPRTGSGPTTGSGGVRRLGSWLGNATGWNDARRGGKAIVDRDEPPVTWGQAWREGLESGKERGRERFDAGQQRKAEKLAEREAQQGWLELAEQRSAAPASQEGASPLVQRWQRRTQRNSTCPDCGHGNTLNNSRALCPCSNEQCACGDPDAWVSADADGDVPDLSQPVDDEQRWGPPDEAEPAPAPVDEVAEKRRERDPEPAAQPAHDETPAPTGDGTPEHEETDVSAPTAPTAGLSGEIINFDSARDVARSISGDMSNLSDAATETAAKHRATVARCDAAIDGLTAIDSDPDTIGEFLALREQAMEALVAAEKAQVEAAESSAYAASIVPNIDARHGAIEEAVRGAKHAAKIDAYKAS